MNSNEPLEDKLDGAKPFMIAEPEIIKSSNFEGYVDGRTVHTSNRKYDLKIPSNMTEKFKKFHTLLHSLDGISFGGKDLAAPEFFFADVVYQSGATTGITIDKETAHKMSQDYDKLDDLMSVKEELGGYKGDIPISFYSAVVNEKELVGNSLASLCNGLNLGRETKKLGISPWKDSKDITGVAQADNPSVITHSRIAPLELIIPDYSPVHGSDLTFKYKHRFGDDGKEYVSHPINIDDTKRIQHFLETTQHEDATARINTPGWKDGKVLFEVAYDS